MLYFKGWDTVSPSHFPNSCMKSRCPPPQQKKRKLDARIAGLGIAILNCMDISYSLRAETPGVGTKRTEGIWAFDCFSKNTCLGAWTLMWKRKKSSIFFKSLLAWVTVTDSFIYVLINSKGNRNQWMKTIHAQMENLQYKPYFTSKSCFFLIQKGCQNFWKWSIMLASTV